MQLVGDLPLSLLGELLSYAHERELEEAIRPLWIAHYAVQKISGAEPIPYQELISSLLSSDSPSKAKAERTPKVIEEDFLSIVASDKLRQRREG